MTVTATRRTALRRFVRHYSEMVAAMAVGMALLGPAVTALLRIAGV